MSFLYPRTVSVRRPEKAVAAGAGPYSAVEKVPYAIIAERLPASIQVDRTGQKPWESLPADAIGKASWRIFIPLRSVSPGAILSRDVIVDDVGIAYQVIAPYWNSLGFQCRAQTSEV